MLLYASIATHTIHIHTHTPSECLEKMPETLGLDLSSSEWSDPRFCCSQERRPSSGPLGETQARRPADRASDGTIREEVISREGRI